MGPESLTMTADLETVCNNTQWYDFSLAECNCVEVRAELTSGLFGWTDSMRKLDMQKNQDAYKQEIKKLLSPGRKLECNEVSRKPIC